MADRGVFGLAYKVQTGLGVVATAPYTLLPVSTFAPGISAQRVDDDTITGVRLAKPGRAGILPAAPAFSANMRPIAYDDLFENLFFSTWAQGAGGVGTTNYLTQGTTRKYMTLEDRQSDAASSTVYRDCMVNTFSLSLEPNALARVEWGFVGTAVTGSPTVTATPVAASAESPYDTWSGTVSLAGATPTVTSLRMTIDNRLAPAYKLGSRVPDRIVADAATCTGTMTLAFAARDRLDDLLADTSRALSFTLVYTTKSMDFSLGAVKFTAWDAPITQGADRFQTVEFAADISSGTHVQLIRDNV